MRVRQTLAFTRWLTGLRDRTGRAKILARIDRLAAGNPGKMGHVGNGVVELKIDFGPGYRVYYTCRGSLLILLLCGGDKGSQESDVRYAKQLASQIKE